MDFRPPKNYNIHYPNGSAIYWASHPQQAKPVADDPDTAINIFSYRRNSPNFQHRIHKTSKNNISADRRNQ